MKAKELIKILQQDPEREVIIASDPEGNSFDYLHDISTGAYDEENCEIGLEKLTKEAKKLGYTQDDVLVDGVKVFCFWP